MHYIFLLASKPMKSSPSSKSMPIYPRPSPLASQINTSLASSLSSGMPHSSGIPHSSSIPHSSGMSHSSSLPLRDGMPLTSSVLFTHGLSGGTMTLGGGIGSLSTLTPSFSTGFNTAHLSRSSHQVSLKLLLN